MLGEQRIREISDGILALSSADQTEVVVLANDSALTRFANSTIHQNVAETDCEVRIRVVLGQRIGVATTNNLEEVALAEALNKALAIARLQPENPDFQSLPGPLPIPEVRSFSEATAHCTPETRASGAGAICLLAREAGVVASGALTTAVLEIAVANSLGTFAYFATTQADVNTVIMSDDSAGYAEALALDVNHLDFEAVGREAIEKCQRSRDPSPARAGGVPGHPGALRRPGLFADDDLHRLSAPSPSRRAAASWSARSGSRSSMSESPSGTTAWIQMGCRCPLTLKVCPSSAWT
jgi:PmbA protein